MNKPRTTAKKPASKPVTPEPVVEKVDPELNAEFQDAGANVNITADMVQDADRRHQAARAVFEYVGSKIRAKYGLGPADKILPDGTIERAQPDSRIPA